MNPRHALPEEIYFYLRNTTYPCSLPFPNEFSESQYMHKATIESGHEAAGPAATLRFNPSTVIGLRSHHMVDGKCDAQLCLEVPVTRKYNPCLAPKRIMFQPSSSAMMHSSTALPRIIVPVLPLGIENSGIKSATVIKTSRATTMQALTAPWEGTPKPQRLYFALVRWKKIVDVMYADVPQVNPFEEPEGGNVSLNFADAAVGTPFRYGSYYPRTALDVPPYTTIYFQNARIAMTAPKPKELQHRHLLPRTIYFYVRTATAEVRFPLPEAEYPAAKYLHCAAVMPGHEAGGPTSHMTWDIDTVVGLKKHHCNRSGAPAKSMQLVLVVPSTKGVNEGVEPTQLAFSPANAVQLHLSKRLPRIVVPIFPISSANEVSRHVDPIESCARLKAMRQLIGSWGSFAKRELRLAGFVRWVRVCSLLPSRKVFIPPEPQLGSPFVELLKDKGEETNRCRWPRMARSVHMTVSSAGDDAGNSQTAKGGQVAAALKLDVSAAQRVQQAYNGQSTSGRSPSTTSSGTALSQTAFASPAPSARSSSPFSSARQSPAEGGCSSHSNMVAAALARHYGIDTTRRNGHEPADGVAARSSSPRSLPRARSASPRGMMEQRGTFSSNTPRTSSPRNQAVQCTLSGSTPRTSSPRNQVVQCTGPSPRGTSSPSLARPRALTSPSASPSAIRPAHSRNQSSSTPRGTSHAQQPPAPSPTTPKPASTPAAPNQSSPTPRGASQAQQAPVPPLTTPEPAFASAASAIPAPSAAMEAADGSHLQGAVAERLEQAFLPLTPTEEPSLPSAVPPPPLPSPSVSAGRARALQAAGGAQPTARRGVVFG